MSLSLNLAAIRHLLATSPLSSHAYQAPIARRTMSQVRRQDSDGSQHSPKLPLSSSIRSQLSSHSPLTGSLIPRDYLGTRPDVPTIRSDDPTVAGPRIHTSSPLCTSFQPLSYRGDDLDPSQSPVSPKSTVDHSLFKNRITDGPVANARFPTASSSVGKSFFMPQGVKEMEQPGDRQKYIGDMMRKTSDTSDASSHVADSRHSPMRSLQSRSDGRQEHGSALRTSSIDSAISSLTSGSHSHKTSLDTNILSSSNINNLISAAGSAEAVIVHLLKEKHHTTSQNSQLWKLVDKQRTLILGLNRDLERALKEKERYRKKLRELQNHTPPLPTRLADGNGISENHKEQHPIQESVSETPQSPSESSDRATDANARGGLENIDTASEPLHVQTSLASLTSDATSSPSPAVDDSPTNLVDRVVAVSTRAEVPVRSSDQRSSNPELCSHDEREASHSVASLGSAKDSSYIDNKRNAIPPPSRKPPPAPLDLGRMERSNIEHANTYDSGSEYDDILEVDELPETGRGRRKTREDDDREREAALIKEREARSLSKKKASKTSKTPADRGNLLASNMPIGLPLSPRPQLITERETPAIVLTPRMALGASLNDRLAFPPPKSPGLPLSPRPEDRPLGSPLPRLPREIANSLPIPQTPSNDGFPPQAMNFQPPLVPGPPDTLTTNSYGSLAHSAADVANQPIPTIDASVRIDSPRSPREIHGGIYQGLISEDYPNLLLPPNALPLVEVRVYSSRLRPSRNSYMGVKTLDEEPVFTLSIFSRSEASELWRVEKIIGALPQLDQQMKELTDFGGKLPDRSIFSGHSPAKVDARRAALNSYFDTLLDTPMDEKAAVILCQFLTSDAIEPRDDETSLVRGNGQTKLEVSRGADGKPRKEGYLTKRGKNFGGWKARYFVLHGPELKYYDSPGGPHLGTIKVYNSQIGKQSQNSDGQSNSPSRGDDDSDNHYRHAFLILEPKKKDSSALVRHVLCAESDEERDAWVEALLEYVEGQSENEGTAKQPSKNQTPGHGKPYSNANAKLSKSSSNGSKSKGKGIDSAEPAPSDTVQGFSYEDAVPAEPPIIGFPQDKHVHKLSQTQLGPSSELSDTSQIPNTTVEHGHTASHGSKVISGPTNGTVIQDAGAWGNKTAAAAKERKRSIWGFRTRSSADLASQLQASHEPTLQAHHHSQSDKKDHVKPVFGMPLAEAVQFCPPQGVDVDLPAVVYRCIEYLKAKGAVSEEGIFRLSGSNVVVKALKERFNTEGDLDFLAGDQYYDVHAVASLFKQYLRELPTTVLTRELHLDFLRVLDLDGRQTKTVAFNSLVHKLPKPNLALLRALVEFLIVIVNNSDVNKMTVRNVGIVFAPTLNIPAPVFSMFLTDFDSIFGEVPDSNTDPVVLTVESPVSSEDVRSPRHQIFSDIPTPAYDQASFPIHSDHGSNVHQETGFISMKPSYRRQSLYKLENSNPGQPNYAQFSSMNSMLSPNTDSSRLTKAARRESSLFFMETNHGYSSDAN